VKTRHAAALALVGWYLMVLPTDNANHIDPLVPWPKWVVLRAFDRLPPVTKPKINCATMCHA
jgi:hypothetical protein